MHKDKPSTYWNHRVITKLYVDKFGSQRLFSIVEVHYEDGKPTGYGEKGDILSNHESVKGLKWTINRAKEAFKKPVLDADNWPNEWHDIAMKDVVDNVLKNEKSF